jgi:CheY-like chemotaxis protein
MPEPDDPKPLSILVVDDSEMMRRVISAILRSRQWSVWEAHDGRTGVEMFQQCKPDAVILDLAMPNMDGVETAKQMSECDPDIPLILFTVFEVQGVEKAAQEAGISAIIRKSEAWTLLENIESLVEGAVRPAM